MIYLYSGTPGSGKSLHVAHDIFTKLRLKKQSVIANFDINLDVVSSKLFSKKKKKIGDFVYKDNYELTVKFLVDYAYKNHKIGKEGQTLICIDECQIIFNPREFQRKDRLEWIEFFTQHRKLGYNIILTTQNDRLIDRQIRGLIEYNVIHRKVNNFKIGQLFPVKTFVAVNYWYGVKEKLGVEFFVYRKKLGNLYNSYKMFDEKLDAEKEENKNMVVFNVKDKVKNENVPVRDSSGGVRKDGGTHEELLTGDV